MLKLSKFFSDPDEERLHVVIQPPPIGAYFLLLQHSSILIMVCSVSSGPPSVDLINLNCFILGDDINHIF